MSDWKQLIRQRLARLPENIREATIQQVISDTEAGRPFGAKQAAEEVKEITAQKEQLENQLAERDEEVNQQRATHGRGSFVRRLFNKS